MILTWILTSFLYKAKCLCVEVCRVLTSRGLDPKLCVVREKYLAQVPCKLKLLVDEGGDEI